MNDLEIIDEIQKIRSKNNVNWMDILRLAFKHAPNDARKLIIKVNEHDSEISKLVEQLSSNGRKENR
jgi:predicted transcriptional regulator